MLILELASNITLRLFLRPFEAILSLKSLFERVPGGLQGSYFVWRAKMRNYYHLESSLEAVRPLLKSEAARGRSSDLEPPRPPYMILKWLALTSGCQIWPRPRMASAASSDLGSSKQRPRSNLTSKSHLGRILSCFNMIFLRKTKNPIFTQSFSHCVKGAFDRT